MAERIVVIGAGGFGRETLDVIEAINLRSDAPIWTVVGVVDDDPSPANRERLAARGYAHLGGVTEVGHLLSTATVAIAVGAPAVRARLAAMLSDREARLATLVHPSAVLGSQLSIGAGTIVCAGAQVSTNVRLGQRVHVNPGAIVGHDAVLGDDVSVNPGAVISGDVTVHERALIGAGSVVLQGLEIGEDVIVGASACVTRDVLPALIVKGVPAR